MVERVPRRRIELLDLWRSVSVAVMVCWHAAYDLALFGRLDMAAFDRWPLRAVRYAVAVSFLLISGAASRFSRSAARRGFTIFCAGFAVTAATAFVGMPVGFGILQLIGASMLISSVQAQRLQSIRGVLMPVLCVAAHFSMLALCRSVRVGVKWLYPLGLRYPGFYSADYYPLLPWFPVFLFGIWLGGVIERNADAPVLSRRYPPALTFAGRHSLVIYLAHQPVLYGLCALWLKQVWND